MIDKEQTQFISGQFVDCFENKLYIVKSIPGLKKSAILEIYSLNEELFEFMREYEFKFDIQPSKVIFHNEGIMMIDVTSTFYYLGSIPLLIHTVN